MLTSGRRSRPDSRDYPYQSRRPGVLGLPLPRAVDRSGSLPPVWDQGAAGTCEAHGGAAKLAELYPGYEPSRLAIHYLGRKLENTLHQSVGIETRDLMKVLQAGVIPESAWPYDLTRLDAPPPADPDRRMIGKYVRLRGERELLEHLAWDGCVVLSFLVPDQFMVDGTFPSSMHDEAEDAGWHCVLAVGYDLDRGELLCRNSWGDWWGIQGHFWMRLEWATSVSTGNDMWSAVAAPPGTVAGIEIEGAVA